MGDGRKRVPSMAEIRALAGPEVFERGRDYRRQGAVFDLVMRGDDLTAAVTGSESEPYRVSVRLARGRAAAHSCTCPYEWGGACKHVVATLLALADNPDAVSARPPLADLLAPLSADTLRDLILKRAQEDPDLTGWIEADLAAAIRPGGSTVDARPVAARARAVLSGQARARDFWDGYRASGNADALRLLADKAVPHMEAGDGRSALRILEAVADPVVEDWLAEGYQSDEEFYLLFHDLGRMMAEAALLSDLDAGERETLVDTLENWDAGLSEYGVEDGFGIAVRALQAGWDAPALEAILKGGKGPWPRKEEDDLAELELTAIRLRVLDARGQTEAYLNLARAAGAEARVATMLARLGRMQEAVAHGRARFTLPDEALDLARTLMAEGRAEDAFGIAEAGLVLGTKDDGPFEAPWRPGSSVAPLAHWLREAAAEAGRTDLAVKAARAAFTHSLSREDFEAARAVAGEGWGRLKSDLLAVLLAAKRARDRAEILLGEGMIDEAVAGIGEARDFVTPDPVLLRVMEAAHARHPDWVIRLAEGRAAPIMDGGSAGRYDEAAAWLARAAQAYDSAGRIDEWTARIEGLIDTHRRKYKLRPLLEALRYDA